MAEDQSQPQDSEPGYVVMTPNDVVLLSRKAAEEAVNRYRAQSDDGSGGGENLIGLDGKFVKQLQNTVGVFNALKDFSSSPLQKVVEEKVGQFAAGMVENAFSGPRSPEKKSIIETILNSQFAYGLGASLGNKSPELIEAMSRNLGKEQTQHIIDNVITKGTQGPGQIAGGQGSQDNIELLLSLDPNNPEHIAAYSESQGGLPPDVARKMLMIHQDAIIKRFGGDAKVQKSSAGQHTQQQKPQPSRAPTAERAPESIPEEPMQYNDYSEFPKENVVQRDDVTQRNDATQSNIQGQPGGNSNNDMLEVMKKFSSDVGQAMSAMIEEISTLKGTVSQLRGEIDTIRSNGPISPPISPHMSPGVRTAVQIPTTGQPSVIPPSVVQPQAAPLEPMQIKRQYIPPTTSPPIASPPSNQPKPRVGSMVGQPLQDGLIEQDILKPIEGDLHKEPIDQETIVKPIDQEQDKTFEDIMGIREHNLSPEELTDIKPKDTVRQPVQPIKPVDTGPDTKWTDDDLGRDIANARNTEALRKSATKQKDITEELKKAAKEEKVVPIIKEDQKAENIIKTGDTISREEKRPITPIKRSEVHKKLIPSLKKVEDSIK